MQTFRKLIISVAMMLIALSALFVLQGCGGGGGSSVSSVVRDVDPGTTPTPDTGTTPTPDPGTTPSPDPGTTPTPDPGTTPTPDPGTTPTPDPGTTPTPDPGTTPTTDPGTTPTTDPGTTPTPDPGTTPTPDPDTTPTPDTTAPAISTVQAVYNASEKQVKFTIQSSDAGTGIKSVIAVVTPPTGADSTVLLSYNSSTGVYGGVYANIPTNWTFQSRVYNVTIIVEDNSSNKSESKTSFEVPGLESPPSPGVLKKKAKK